MGSAEAVVLSFPALGERTNAREAPAAAMPAAERARLDALRGLAVSSRLRPAIHDLTRACALLLAEPELAAGQFGVAFFCGLRTAAVRAVRLRPAGSSSVSQDERWLLQLVARLKAGDETSARALIGFRVMRPCRRLMLFLARGLAKEV